MAHCIQALALCFIFAVPFAWSRRVSHDSNLPLVRSLAWSRRISHSPLAWSRRISHLAVGGFDYNTDEEALKKHFGVAGTINDLYFKSRRGAVITYAESIAASKAVFQLHKTSLEGQDRYMLVKRLHSEADKGSHKVLGKESAGRAIVASGFDSVTNQAALEKHFGDVGTIESCFFLSAGAAVVTFVEAASAQRAVTELGGTTMAGQTGHVAVKLDKVIVVNRLWTDLPGGLSAVERNREDNKAKWRAHSSFMLRLGYREDN